ncbi:MAG: zf-HC2 domain-containing protein [Thiohalomonadales bacterium]
MNCIETQQKLQEWMDDLISPQTTAAIQTHLHDCAPCQTLYDEEQALRNALRSMPIEPARAGFDQRVIRRAQQHSVAQQHKRQGFLQGMGVAVAASVTLFLLITLFPGLDSNDQTTVAKNESDDGLRIALHETHNLKLAFYANKNMKNATVSITLPENVALVGYPGERVLSWQVNLAKGDNTLSLPIKALKLDVGVLVARIEHETQSKMLKVKLRITQPGMSLNGGLSVNFS